MNFKRIWLRLWGLHGPRRSVIKAQSDQLPAKMPVRNLVVTEDGDEVWSAGLLCPCGCHRIIELLLIDDADPRWKLTHGENGSPTLAPSVWLRDGCKSHFWLRNGRIIWCD
jgi:hypothetical protein